MAFQHQVEDLNAWTEIYLARDEALPTTVRNSHKKHQVSEFVFFFGPLKTFSLRGTIELGDPHSGSAGSLHTVADLSVYPLDTNEPRHLLVKFKGDINNPDGLSTAFNSKFASGKLTLFIYTAQDTTKQVWGHLDAHITNRAVPVHVDGKYYLCPVVPPAQSN